MMEPNKLRQLIRKEIQNSWQLSENEVAVLDMREHVQDFIDEIQKALRYASDKSYQIYKVSQDIKIDYPELSEEIRQKIEPILQNLENVYPEKLQSILKDIESSSVY